MVRRVVITAVLALAGAALAAGGASVAAPTFERADAGAAAAPTQAAAAARKRKIVRVRDNFFSPSRTRVRRGTRVVWRWPRRNANTHNVVLTRAPRGVRRFRSASAVSGYRFARRLRRPGRYRVICTFHANMKMRIRVRR